jgi:hypothetical protein
MPASVPSDPHRSPNSVDCHHLNAQASKGGSSVTAAVPLAGVWGSDRKSERPHITIVRHGLAIASRLPLPLAFAGPFAGPKVESGSRQAGRNPRHRSGVRCSLLPDSEP